MLCIVSCLIINELSNFAKFQPFLWLVVEMYSVYDNFCPGAARPALCCPAAGEGPRGRQRRSAVKLTPVIIPPDWPCRTVGNGRGSGRTKGIFVDGSSGPTMLFWGFFFYWPESGFLVKNRRARVTNGCRRHFACPIQHLARVDENSIEDHKCEGF